MKGAEQQASAPFIGGICEQGLPALILRIAGFVHFFTGRDERPFFVIKDSDYAMD